MHWSKFARLAPFGWLCVGMLGTLCHAEPILVRPSGAGVPTVEAVIDPDLVYPTMIVGSPSGVPPITPAGRVDANVPNSPYAGVVSMNLNGAPGSFICSGVLIGSEYVVTAAHCLDTNADGGADFTPGQIKVVFNQNNPTNNAAGATIITAAQISVHPNWTGFNHPSVNDDMAILRLSSPAPAGVPIYPLSTNAFGLSEDIYLAGYGNLGDGVTGEQTLTASYFVKRTGQNLASRFGLDDEAPGTAKETFLFDFDGPTNATDTFGDGLTFGNDKEVTLAGGDSGGAAFTWHDDNNNTFIDQGELTLFGIATFGQSFGGFSRPLFGSQAGGMLVSNYLPFIQSVVPEPSTWTTLVVGSVFLLTWQRRKLRLVRGK